MQHNKGSRQIVWDLPLRLVHWSVVALFATMWWSAEVDQWDIHRYAGYLLAGVMVFRVYWGLAGASNARFSNMFSRPGHVWQYARHLFKRHYGASAGHNPLGAYSALLLITLLCLQVVLGLFAIDVDGWEGGPFSDYVSFDTARWCAQWHEIVFNLLLALVCLHIAAVGYYWLWRGQNLLRAMITGKSAAQPLQPTRFARPLHYVLGILLAATVSFLLYTW